MGCWVFKKETKLDSFLAKKQYPQRKLLSFLNWHSAWHIGAFWKKNLYGLPFHFWNWNLQFLHFQKIYFCCSGLAKHLMSMQTGGQKKPKSCPRSLWTTPNFNFAMLYLLKWCPIFDDLPLCQFIIYNHFLWGYWFLAKNLSNFENLATHITIIYAKRSYEKMHYFSALLHSLKKKSGTVAGFCTDLLALYTVNKKRMIKGKHFVIFI